MWNLKFMCVWSASYVLSWRAESQRGKKAITFFFVGNNLNMPKTALMIFIENINSCVLWFYVFFFAPPPFSRAAYVSYHVNFFFRKWKWIGIKDLLNSLLFGKYCVVNLIISSDIFIILKLMGIIISLRKSYVVFVVVLW